MVRSKLGSLAESIDQALEFKGGLSVLSIGFAADVDSETESTFSRFARLYTRDLAGKSNNDNQKNIEEVFSCINGHDTASLAYNARITREEAEKNLNNRRNELNEDDLKEISEKIIGAKEIEEKIYNTYCEKLSRKFIFITRADALVGCALFSSAFNEICRGASGQKSVILFYFNNDYLKKRPRVDYLLSFENNSGKCRASDDKSLTFSEIRDILKNVNLSPSFDNGPNATDFEHEEMPEGNKDDSGRSSDEQILRGFSDAAGRIVDKLDSMTVSLLASDEQTRDELKRELQGNTSKLLASDEQTRDELKRELQDNTSRLLASDRQTRDELKQELQDNTSKLIASDRLTRNRLRESVGSLRKQDIQIFLASITVAIVITVISHHLGSQGGDENFNLQMEAIRENSEKFNQQMEIINNIYKVMDSSLGQIPVGESLDDEIKPTPQ